MGPGSWGWVERAYASNRALFAPGKLEAITVPVLILATSNDKLVSAGAIEEAAKRLKDVRLVRFGKEARSEEHTSELQSIMRISYAVLCLQETNTTEATI